VTLPTAGRPRWVPYLAVASSLGLMLYSGRHNAFYPVLSLMIASVVVVAVVAVRQLAAQRELIDAQRELQAAHDELAALATTDALTGLANHRALVAAIDHELERCRRSGGRFALAFLDLDLFKALNDTLGHAAGDRALSETAATITSVLRAVDTVGRWGGEEFVVLLPDTGPEGALEAADRIRAAVARHRFASALGARLTCSIGVSVHPEDGTRRDALLQNADRAMYAAKQLGRNQVVAAGDAAAAAMLENTSSSREEQAMLGAVEALAAVVDARDNYTASHSADVAVLAQRVAMMLGCDANQTHLIGLAARLHDIGKVAVPDAVLRKPARLTDDEWLVIRRHPGIGADIAARIPRLRSITPLIRAHHERFDGTGYPDGLAGEEIPLGARIICAADAYDAMITDRPYEPGRSHEDALEELRRCAGAQFDPRVVDVLVEILSEERRAA
jgi:two-component system cell cycle response regulator